MNIIGHRGNGRTTDTPFAEGKAPQNTLPSFQQALENGADGVEFDVFLSKDMIPVIADQNKILNYAISDLYCNDLKKIALDHDRTILSLEEALVFFAQYNFANARTLLINIELKGPSVVEPTLKVINKISHSHDFDKSQICYSSFDWDKLSLVRELDDDARIQPTISTMQLFNPHAVAMPGYLVSLKAHYNNAALRNLRRFILEKNCSAIDAPTSDIRPELIDMADRLNVGFCTHPTGPRRKETAQSLLDTVYLLKDFAKAGSNVVWKVDDIEAALNLLAQPEQTPPIRTLEKIMGMSFI